jgi:hypothetical protein
MLESHNITHAQPASSMGGHGWNGVASIHLHPILISNHHHSLKPAKYTQDKLKNPPRNPHSSRKRNSSSRVNKRKLLVIAIIWYNIPMNPTR